MSSVGLFSLLPRDVLRELVLYIKPYQEIFALENICGFILGKDFKNKYSEIHWGMTLDKKRAFKHEIATSLFLLGNRDLHKEIVNFYFNNPEFHLKEFLLHLITHGIPFDRENNNQIKLDFELINIYFITQIIDDIYPNFDVSNKMKFIEPLQIIFFNFLVFFNYDVYLFCNGTIEEILEKYPVLFDYSFENVYKRMIERKMKQILSALTDEECE